MEQILWNGLPAVCLVHENGDSAILTLFGATVVSFFSGGREMLFISQQAVFDGKKPIRGGIPIVFPQFGQSLDLNMASHGFARQMNWQVQQRTVSSVTMLLVSSPETLLVFPSEFRLVYQVSVANDRLSMNLTATEVTRPYHLLLHTYLRIPSIFETQIYGLEGSAYKDKLHDMELAQPTNHALAIDQEVDRIYINPSSVIKLGNLVRVESIDSDVVVWNPWIEKSIRMTDFGNDEYMQMVCIEPGIVSRVLEESYHLRQDIVPISL